MGDDLLDDDDDDNDDDKDNNGANMGANANASGYEDPEERANIEEQIEELEAAFQELDKTRKHPGFKSVERNAKERWRRNSDTRQKDGKRQRTFAEWLRIDIKRKRRALKRQREHLHNHIKTKKRQIAGEIAKETGPGGVVAIAKLNFHSFGPKTSRRVRRGMQILAHCSFVDHDLRDACRNTSTLLAITGESHTTKTCPKCFKEHKNVGAAKTFKCDNPNCDYEAPRDGKGAYCIGQRFLTNH
jgi:transposase